MSRAATTDYACLSKRGRLAVGRMAEVHDELDRMLEDRLGVPAIHPVDMHRAGAVVIWCMLVPGEGGNALGLVRIGRQDAGRMPPWWTGVEPDCPAGRWCRSRCDEFVGEGERRRLPEIDETVVEAISEIRSSFGDYVLTPQEAAEEAAAPRCVCWRDDSLDDLAFLVEDNFRYDFAREPGTMPCGQLNWAIVHGIAPCQPFALEILEPKYFTTSTQDGTEHDVEVGANLVWVEPWPAERVAKVWSVMLRKLERWNEEGRKFEALRQRRAADLLERQWADRSKMEVECEGLFDKVRVTLCSTLTDPLVNAGWPGRLATETGADRDQALERLAEKAGHGLTAAMLAKMPRHRRG